MSIYYEIPKINVILEKNKGDKDKDNDNDSNENLAGVIAGSIIGGLVVISLITFLVYRFYTKKKS